MAKSNTSNISIRMDSNLKAAAEALYEELGMNLSTAFNIFVRQSLRERGIPFKITEGTPNKETVSAMLEAERIAKDPSVKGYHDVDEFFTNLDKWPNLKLKTPVLEYWIVNPMKQMVQVYRFGNVEDSTQYSFDDEISVGIYDDLKICITDLLR